MALADKLVVNDFLKRTLPIFRPNDIQKLSNGLTSLESAFNVISTGLVNVNNIQKAHARSQKLNAREIVAETKQITTAGVLQEPTTLSSIGPLQTLLEPIKKLNDALERLDLTPKNVVCPPGSDGDASPDIDIDIDGSKKRKRRFSLPRMGRIGRSFTSTIGRTLSLGVSRALRTSGVGPQTGVLSDVTKTLLGIAAGTAGLSAIFGGGTFGGGGGSFGGGGASGTFDGNVSGSTKGSFQNIMDIAAKVGAPHPEVVAAQWALESAYGTKMSGKNNPFGQKATANEPGTSRRTREVINGRNVMITDRFKDYDSLDDAIRDHVNKWNKKYTQAGTTPLEAVSNIKAKGYATDPNYVNSVARVIASNGIDPNQPFTYTKEMAALAAAKGQASNVMPGGTYSGPGLGLAREGGKRSHQGLDIFGPIGTPIKAMDDGTVVYSERRSGDGGGAGFGIAVQIKHDNGLTTKYAHLSRLAGLKQGDRVSGGQVVGYSGDTGNAKGTQPHLHFEVWRGSQMLEPTDFLRSGATVTPQALSATENVLKLYGKAPPPLLARRPAPPPKNKSTTAAPPAKSGGKGFSLSKIFESILTR